MWVDPKTNYKYRAQTASEFLVEVKKIEMSILRHLREKHQSRIHWLNVLTAVWAALSIGLVIAALILPLIKGI